MVGKPHGTTGTFRDFPAVHAYHCAGSSTAVQQNNGLPIHLVRIQNCFLQGATEGQVISSFQFLMHIHNGNLRQCTATEATLQGVQPIDAVSGTVHGFHRRGGRTQEYQCLFFAAPPKCHFPGIVAGSILRFIGVFLFFIQNNETRIHQGSKHRAAGSHYQFRCTAADTLPLVVTLSRRKAGVQHRYRFSKIGSHDTQQLGSQCNFRYQQHGTFSICKARLNQFDINRCFSGSGHAVEQCCTRRFLFSLTVQPMECDCLLVIQNQRSIQFCRLNLPAAQHRAFRQSQIPQFLQPVDRGR